jgi:hypothetical protein
MRAQENRLFSAVFSVGDEGVDDLQPPLLILIHFLADPLFGEECLDVELMM